MKIVRKKASFFSNASAYRDRDLLSRARSAPFYDPKKSDSYLSIAKEYLRMYDDKGAESPLYEALKFNHSNSAAHYLLAEINYWRARDRSDSSWREAEGHLQTAAKLDPKNPEIWALYGFLLREIASEDEYLRDSERIIEYLQRALKLGILDIDEPSLPGGGRKTEVVSKLAHTFKDTKKFAEALKIFQKQYKLHGSVGFLREIAICYEKLNNNSKANELNLKVIKTKDANHYPDAFFYVAFFAYSNKRFDDALKYAEKLIELERVFDHPGYTDKARNATLLSQILVSLNNVERALTVVNTALLNAPQHSMLLLQKSAFLADIGRYKESIEVLDLVEEIEKKKSSRLIPPTVFAGLRASILLHSEDYRGAIRIASKVLKIQPDTIGALDVIGRAYLELKQYDKSLKAFQKMKKLRPDEVPLLTLSSLYLRMGNVKNAISSLEKWLKQNPSLNVPNIVRGVDDKLTILLMGAALYHEVGNGNPSVKNLKRALDLCNKALKLSQSDEVLAYKIHILLHLKRFKDAYETFLKIKNSYSLPKEIKQEHFLLHLDVAYCNQKLKNPPKDFRATTAFVKNFTKVMKNPNFKKYFSNYCFNKELHAIVSELTVRRGMK